MLYHSFHRLDVLTLFLLTHATRLQEIQLTPTAGFVIKTTLQTYHAASGALPLTKLFINVSSAPQIPPPPEGGKVNPLCAVAGCEETLDKGGQGHFSHRTVSHLT